MNRSFASLLCACALMTGATLVVPQVFQSIAMAQEESHYGQEKVADNAALKIEESHVNFGSLKEGESTDILYKVSNTTDKDINITRIQPSCGCTAADDNPSVVPAGESVEIKLSFNSKGRIGKNFKNATIITDDPNQPNYRVSFEGNVTTELMFEEQMVDFGDVGEGKSASKQFTLVYSGDDELKIEEVTADRDTVSVELVQSGPMTDKASGEKATGYQFEATLKEGTPNGNVYGFITVKTNHPDKEEMRINYRAMVLGDITLSPAQLVAISDTNSTIKRGMSLTARAAEKIEILKITPPDDITVDISVVDTAAANRKQLMATFKTGDNVGRIQGDIKVEIKLDDDEVKTITVPALLITRQARAARPQPNRPAAAGPAVPPAVAPH